MLDLLKDGHLFILPTSLAEQWERSLIKLRCYRAEFEQTEPFQRVVLAVIELTILYKQNIFAYFQNQVKFFTDIITIERQKMYKGGEAP